MFSNFQQRFPLQDLRQWVPLLDMFPLDPEVVSTGPPDAETLLETFLPGSVYGLYQKGDMFPRPFWVTPPKKVFQSLPMFSILPIESLPLQKIDLISSCESELPITLWAAIANNIPGRAQISPPEIPAILKKISTPCFAHPSTPIRPGTPTTRPSTPVDVRSSLPHPQKSSLSNTLSGSFSFVKKSPSVRDFLGTAANFAKEAKSKPAPQKEPRIAFATLISSNRPIPSNETVDCPSIVREEQKHGEQTQMALVQYHSPVIQLPFSSPIKKGTGDAYDVSSKGSSCTSPEQAQQNFLGFTSHIKPSKEVFGVSIDPQYCALVSRYLERLQKKVAKVQSQFSPAVPNTSPLNSQQNSLVRTFGKYCSLDPESSSAPGVYIDPGYRSYVHHFLRKSVWKTAAVGSSRPIREVMQELREDSIFLDTIAPGAILQALDDAVVARLRQSMSTQDSNSSVTRFGDASARMDDLRRFLRSLTKDDGQCVEFEHWIEEIPADCEQTLRIDFTSGKPAIHGSSLGPKAVREAVRRRIKAFRSQSSQESKFEFNTPVALNDTPLKRTLGSQTSSGSLRLYKRTRNGSSDDVSLQRSKSLTIITTSNEKHRAIGNSSVRELILSPINTSSTQTDGQISDTLFVESLADSPPSTPTSTAGSMERWERSSMLSRSSTGSFGSTQTGVTVPSSGPSSSIELGSTTKQQISEEENWNVPIIQLSQPPCSEQAPEDQKEDDVQSFLVPAYNRFLTPKKSRSISEITFDSPKEYRAERLKRGFSSTSSLSKLSSSAVCLPTHLSTIEPQPTNNEQRSTRDLSESLDVVTQFKELEDMFASGPAPILPAEPRRADFSYSNGEGHKSAQGLLKEIAEIGEDVKRVTESSRKTIIKDVKIAASKSAEEEAGATEDKTAKKGKLFGRLKDRVKGLKKKVSGAMKGGKEN
jgi:hypothetical protein